MRSALVVVTAAAAVAVMTACSASETTEQQPTAATTPMTSVVDRAGELCSRTGSDVLGTIENDALTEASGLVASRSHPGVLWVHNDGPDGAGVFGVGPDGRDLGFHPLVSIDAVDVEDIALVTGAEGDELLLADIGDNDLRRDRIRLYRFAEPDPGRPGPVDEVEVLEFTYPDGPHNAEALLVDEPDGRFVIVTKEQELVDGRVEPFGRTAPAFVFEGELDASRTELELAGMLDTVALEEMNSDPTPHPVSLLGFGGIPTGGDVTDDGSLVALRTYETVWVWQRPAGGSVADALLQLPCQLRTVSERQGEAVAFVGDGVITLGEGDHAQLNALGR